MNRAITSTTLRANLFDVIDEIDKKREYLLVTKKGKPVSAIVNLDLFEDLLALKSPKYLESIKEARKNYKKGDTFNLKEVFGEL
jgi:prevent-host-death family protein